jgi:hypothetical protein
MLARHSMPVIFLGTSSNQAASHTSQHRRKLAQWASGTIKGRVAFNVWNLPAVSVQELPSLQSLPLELPKFVYDYLLKSLGLPKPADHRGRPSTDELSRVLREIWSRTRVDHTLEPGVHCTQVRERLVFGSSASLLLPLFVSDKTWKCNPMQYVAVIPPKKYTDIPFAQFDLADEAHRRQLWFGRAQLFFRCAFQDSNKHQKFKVDLVLVSCLYDF